MLQRLVETLDARKVFRRRRKSKETRALGVLLYYLGLSCREAQEVLVGFGGGSHEAVRGWYHRCRALFDPPGRERRAVAVDETHLEVHGQQWYLFRFSVGDAESLLHGGNHSPVIVLQVP